MSIELYLQEYQGKAEPRLTQIDVLSIFGNPATDERYSGFYNLGYDQQNFSSLTITGSGGFATAICIHRPFGHPKLYQSIFECLQRGPFVVFAPGGNCPVVAQKKIIERLPPDMIDNLGLATLVTEPKSISAALFDQSHLKRK